MKRHQGEDSKSVIKSVLESVKEWKKTGPMEVKAILNSPNADLPVLMGLYQSKIIKNGTTGYTIKEDGSLEQNGTGPFIMESFQPGVKSVHRRNENYFREGANLDALEITAITDPVARVNALLAGDMQIIAQVDPKAFRQIETHLWRVAEHGCKAKPHDLHAAALLKLHEMPFEVGLAAGVEGHRAVRRRLVDEVVAALAVHAARRRKH